VARDAAAAAGVLLGRTLAPADFERSFDAARRAKHDADAPDVVLPLGESADLRALYYAGSDDLRLEVPSLLNEANADTSAEVGRAAAERVARGALDQLRRANPAAGRYDLARARLGTTEFGVGRADEPPVQWVLEYVWTIPRVHNDVEFLNDSIEIAVHRSGRLSRIRQNRVEVAHRPGSSRVPAPNLDRFEARFRRDFPNAKLERRMVAYALPHGVTAGDAEPRAVFAFSELHLIQGRPALSRRQAVAYSLVEEGAAPVLLTPKPAPNEASVRPRPLVP
jgi:hypothetical protein